MSGEISLISHIVNGKHRPHGSLPRIPFQRLDIGEGQTGMPVMAMNDIRSPEIIEPFHKTCGTPP